MSDIQKILLDRESKRHQDRQARIKSLLTDGDKCFEAEIKLVEATLRQHRLRAEEAHRLNLNQMQADADDLRETITRRYLDKLESDINPAKSLPDESVKPEVSEIDRLIEKRS